MASRAIRFDRPFPEVSVTTAALLMESITALGYLFISLIRIVTFAAGLGVGIFVFREGMMAIPAGETITRDICVGFMIKENIACCYRKHQPYRLSGRWLRRECSVADDTDDQEDDSQTVDQLKLFF